LDGFGEIGWVRYIIGTGSRYWYACGGACNAKPILKEFWGYGVKISMTRDRLVSWANYWLVICVVLYGLLWGVLVGLVVHLFVHIFCFGVYLVVPGSDLRGG